MLHDSAAGRFVHYSGHFVHYSGHFVHYSLCACLFSRLTFAIEPSQTAGMLKVTALKRLEGVMAMWLAGTVRGCMLNWHLNVKEAAEYQLWLERNGRDKQTAIKMLSKIMQQWLQGSIRGFILNWRCTYAAENAGPPVRRLVVQERRGKLLYQADPNSNCDPYPSPNRR